MDVQRALATLAEPTRFRIVTLLAEAPRTVGEVASLLGALQPQTTKHLQALEHAGVVRIAKLGRRRVASLDRAAVRELAEHLGELAAETEQTASDDAALTRYAGAIADAEAALASPLPLERTLRFHRALGAPVDAVWDAWTDAARAARWWAPRHFRVSEFVLEPTPGGRVAVAIREGDGAEYRSAGVVVEADRPRRLVFDLAPMDADGRPLFDARHTLDLTPRAAGCELELRIDVVASAPAAASAIGGLEPGWEQLLDALEQLLATG